MRPKKPILGKPISVPRNNYQTMTKKDKNLEADDGDFFDKWKLREINIRKDAQNEITWIEKQLHCTLGVCSNTYRNWIYRYKGFLSEENGFLDYNEWHTSSLSTLLTLAAYLLHPIFNAIYLLITVKVVRDEVGEHSTLSEIDGELPYWIGFHIVIATVAMQKYGVEYPLIGLKALLGIP